MISPTQKLSKPCCLGIFIKASLHSHDWLINWPLMINSISSPTPVPRDRWGAQSSNTSVTRLVLWQPPVSSKHHCISINASETEGLTVNKKEVMKILEALCQEPGAETKHVVLILSQHLNVIVSKPETLIFPHKLINIFDIPYVHTPSFLPAQYASLHSVLRWLLSIFQTSA